ncbi:MAG TPA: hypothetical protein VL689_08200 [Paraburkholderia sp.]|jgi:hypothetical protein|nr:hypothetical protein [Paraburkholderia sp.]
MKTASVKRQRHVRRWTVNAVRVACVATLVSMAATWAGAIYDHPVDDEIVAGMQSPDCTAVRTMKPGSLLTSTLPDDGICRALFLYRGSFANAPDNEEAYRDAVAQSRLDEFQQLLAYVWLLVTVVAGAGYALFACGLEVWRGLSPSERSSWRDVGNVSFSTVSQEDKSC